MERPVNQAKIIVAFFAATLAALVALPAFECTASMLGVQRLRCGGSLVPLLLFGSLIAIPAVVGIAVPLFLLFRRLRWLKWWQIGLGGAVSSVLASLALTSWFKTALSLGSIGMFCYIGVCAGIVFWLVGVRGNSP